jgi:hypothetical protein
MWFWMHAVLDAVSLEIARQVAARVTARPELIQIGRENLVRWMEKNADSSALMRCYREWQGILEQPVEDVCKALCAETENGQRLRQNSPFAGVLSPEEIWEIKRNFRKRETTAA